MNEELQNAVTELINKTLTGVDQSVSFLQSELPDYISQLLIWYGVYNFILFIIAIGLLFLVYLTVKSLFSNKIHKKQNGEYYKNAFEALTMDNAADTHLIIVVLISLITFVFCSININLIWLKIWLAPKVWLLEYAANLAK